MSRCENCKFWSRCNAGSAFGFCIRRHEEEPLTHCPKTNGSSYCCGFQVKDDEPRLDQPCPFCGGLAAEVKWFNAGTCWMQCSCGARGPKKDASGLAKGAWNKWVSWFNE